MKFVFAGYTSTPQFTQPQDWLKRIDMYAGLLEQLAQTDEVISIEQIDFEGDLQHSGVQYLFRRFTKSQLLFPGKLHRLIKAQKPDVVVIHGLHFPLQVIQLRHALGSSVKIILQNHAELPFNKLQKPLQRLAGAYVDACLFASKEMGLDWVRRGNLPDASKIYEVMEVSSIFYPTDQTEARVRTNVSGSPVFLWVGHLNANKDPLTVVQGFLQFASTHPEARLYMIYRNDDLLPEVQNLVKNHPSGKNIILVGAIPHDDLLYWFNSADFIVSGSHYEGGGTALCEGISCGCIPVVTNIQSFRMMTDNGQRGILFDPGNVDSLCKALQLTTVINPFTMRQAVLEYYTATLSFSAIASRLRAIAGSL
ncbi:glycosyltransferase involved in cell wall biosynthesis [Mucilaginibacter yixingensis]|uniref:Glycosyltransferase involved in cell wall biosynthesis n=1 Tax=Mucilaginibacter yixingensis TaxID=1295612 RepID=A0A2T5J7J1_9SPHI|nr:glycosyltransferase family 4 protein [Mucilaginibacter yixingensis]PTQ95120.1 glycosyltransferase involved in cell wall biosynthesis [Mucilaginibacter yixingensis]